MVISRRCRFVSLSYSIMFSSTACSFIARSSSRRCALASRSYRVATSRQPQQTLSTLVLRPVLTTTNPCRPSLMTTAPYHSSRTAASSSSVEEIMKSFGSSSSSPLVGTDVPLAMQSLLDADCVCFDVDSTVINEEGIVSRCRVVAKREKCKCCGDWIATSTRTS